MKKTDLLAEKRTSLAQNRSFLALERTFAAWLRTGFAISGAGLTISEALKNSTSKNIANIMGIILIIFGILTFTYALIEYYKSYKYVKKVHKEEKIPVQDFKFNLYFGFILALALIIVSIFGLVMIIF